MPEKCNDIALPLQGQDFKAIIILNTKQHIRLGGAGSPCPMPSGIWCWSTPKNARGSLVCIMGATS